MNILELFETEIVSFDEEILKKLVEEFDLKLKILINKLFNFYTEKKIVNENIINEVANKADRKSRISSMLRILIKTFDLVKEVKFNKVLEIDKEHLEQIIEFLNKNGERELSFVIKNDDTDLNEIKKIFNKVVEEIFEESYLRKIFIKVNKINNKNLFLTLRNEILNKLKQKDVNKVPESINRRIKVGVSELVSLEFLGELRKEFLKYKSKPGKETFPDYKYKLPPLNEREVNGEKELGNILKDAGYNDYYENGGNVFLENKSDKSQRIVTTQTSLRVNEILLNKLKKAKQNNQVINLNKLELKDILKNYNFPFNVPIVFIKEQKNKIYVIKLNENQIDEDSIKLNFNKSSFSFNMKTEQKKLNFTVDFSKKAFIKTFNEAIQIKNLAGDI